MRSLLPGLLLALLASACRSAPSLPPRLEGTGAFLSGRVTGLRDAAVLDDRDFVYGLAFSPDSSKVAFSHLALRAFQLGLWSLSPYRPLADVRLNAQAFDVEGVAFSPDGQAVCAASRDGVLRCFSAKDGAPLGSHGTEEPLVTVAFGPDGRTVLVGSARGLVTVLSWPGLSFVSEARVHTGEVRAVAVAPDGRVFTGGWDRSIAVLQLHEREDKGDTARLSYLRKGGLALVAGWLRGQPLALALDARVPAVVLTAEAARTAGLEVTALSETVSLPTALGTTLAKVARAQRLTFKGLTVELDVALCDACVPPGAQGVLGAPFSEAFDIAFDESTAEVVLARKAPGQAPAPRRVMALAERARFRFASYVNDLSVDREGNRLGVAFSEAPAERTREIYAREKRNQPEPYSEANASAVVDARTGAVVRSWHAHRGIVSTAAISPDGGTLATGGWDKRIHVFNVGDPEPIAHRELGWSLRRLRFSADGRLLGAAAWTPQNPIGDQRSTPSAVLYAPVYSTP
ncbi:MAG TPA: aspartyl protease family protein [Myxococcaceae bacterium]|nr:aspartyl protease family protein [Myxococcaceae bacterium]